MVGRAEKAEAGVMTKNASKGRMIAVSQTEIKNQRRRSEWTVQVYHTPDGNANII